MLAETPIVSGIYYILAGTKPYQGLIMTRLPDVVQLLDELNEESGVWFICQTNWDRDTEDPAYDLRRTACERNIGATKQQFDTQKMMELMNTEPTFNLIRGHTVSSQVYQPSNNHFNYSLVDWQSVYVKPKGRTKRNQ